MSSTGPPLPTAGGPVGRGATTCNTGIRCPHVDQLGAAEFSAVRLLETCEAILYGIQGDVQGDIRLDNASHDGRSPASGKSHQESLLLMLFLPIGVNERIEFQVCEESIKPVAAALETLCWYPSQSPWADGP